MRTLATVKDFMSHIIDSDTKYVILISSCSQQELYSNFYMNFPYEMKEMDIDLIEIQPGCIKLYVL